MKDYIIIDRKKQWQHYVEPNLFITSLSSVARYRVENINKDQRGYLIKKKESQVVTQFLLRTS